MKLHLSLLLFLSLFGAQLAVPFPDDCYDVDPDAVECPDHSVGNYFPVPGKCGLYMICRNGCPEVQVCVGCKPFYPDTKKCGGRNAPSCKECYDRRRRSLDTVL